MTIDCDLEKYKKIDLKTFMATTERKNCFHVRHYDNLRKKQTLFGMNDALLSLELHTEKENRIKNSLKKSENRKEFSVAFQVSLNKIEELEETRSKDFEEITLKTERPKSANFFSGTNLFDTELRKRPRSWEPLSRVASFKNITSASKEKRKQKNFRKRLFGVRECHCWQKGRSLSACSSHGFEGEEREPRTYVKYSSHPPRKCRSDPNFSRTTFQECKKISDREKDLLKVMRSLRLLGFELSDFGIFSSRVETAPKWKLEPKSTTFNTKITKRSLSLESLRTTVKRAWIDDCLDESHRRLLAQAAYEEWYFKKEKELWKKREAERIMRMRERENFRNDFQRKKKKSEEEFQKWLHRKSMKRKEDKESLIRKQKNPINKLVKNGEESEKAFTQWKQMKDRELEKKKKQKQKEEEKRIESEKQKNEKKIIAEKAFQRWKTKLEETERLAEIKMQRKKTKKEEEERRKKVEERQISFQMWKASKDEQMRKKIKQIREANRTIRKERQVKLEERIYEAEQAFEDWLEKADLRKQKEYSEVHAEDQKIIPWIPA